MTDIVKKPPMWEYQVVAAPNIPDDLNAHGANGWEVIGLIGQSPAGPMFLFKRTTSIIKAAPHLPSILGPIAG